MYTTVLVPTDGSEGSERAVEHALDIAGTYGATLHALYAVHPASTYPANFTMETAVERDRATGEELTGSVVERAEAAGVAAVAAVREGMPHRVINGYTADNDVDLVVMGTHGRSGVERVLIGSVAERVVRTADAPVLLVRYPE